MLGVSDPLEVVGKGFPPGGKTGVLTLYLARMTLARLSAKATGTLDGNDLSVGGVVWYHWVTFERVAYSDEGGQRRNRIWQGQRRRRREGSPRS